MHPSQMKCPELWSNTDGHFRNSLDTYAEPVHSRKTAKIKKIFQAWEVALSVKCLTQKQKDLGLDPGIVMLLLFLKLGVLVHTCNPNVLR